MSDLAAVKALQKSNAQLPVHWYFDERITALEQRLLFETRASDAEVVNIIMRLANEYQLPLKADDISVRMVGQDRVVDMEYTENVPLIPGVFSYPWKFTPQTSTRMLNAPAR